MTEDERTRRSCFKNQTEKGSEKKDKLREVCWLGCMAFGNLVLISLLQEGRIIGQNPERFQEM